MEHLVIAAIEADPFIPPALKAQMRAIQAACNWTDDELEAALRRNFAALDEENPHG